MVVFTQDTTGVDGRLLSPACRQADDPRRVSDECPRWHFRQAVLANVRGAGELGWDYDFPPGSDMVGEILRGPDAQLRMEVELAGRLGPVVELL